MKRVLFVCLGNICRSPMAEAIFTNLIEKAGRSGEFQIESAGTSAHHEGEGYNRHTIEVLRKHGIQWTGTSRPVRAEDFEHFDYLIAMDSQNLEQLEIRCSSEANQKKIFPMLQFQHELHEVGLDVPDPYYGGVEGFETVYELLADACVGLLEFVDTQR